MRNRKLLPMSMISQTVMSVVRVPTRCRRRLILRSTRMTSVQVDTTPACRLTRRTTATNLVPDVPRRRRAVDTGPSARLRSQSGRQLMPRQNRLQRSRRRRPLQWTTTPATVSLIACRVPHVRTRHAKDRRRHLCPHVGPHRPHVGPHHPRKARAPRRRRSRPVRRERSRSRGVRPGVLHHRLHRRTKATPAAEVVVRNRPITRKRRKEEVVRGRSTPAPRPRRVGALRARSAALLRTSPSPNRRGAGQLKIRVDRTRAAMSCQSRCQHLRGSLPLGQRLALRRGPCHHDRTAYDAARLRGRNPNHAPHPAVRIHANVHERLADTGASLAILST